MGKELPERAECSSGLAGPESVSVPVVELAEEMREGLLALAGGAGLHVVACKSLFSRWLMSRIRKLIRFPR